MIRFVIPYLTGLATIPLVMLVLRFVRELPHALAQARHEREDGTPKKRSHLKPWAWHLFVGLPRFVWWHTMTVRDWMTRR